MHEYVLRLGLILAVRVSSKRSFSNQRKRQRKTFHRKRNYAMVRWVSIKQVYLDIHLFKRNITFCRLYGGLHPRASIDHPSPYHCIRIKILLAVPPFLTYSALLEYNSQHCFAGFICIVCTHTWESHLNLVVSGMDTAYTHKL